MQSRQRNIYLKLLFWCAAGKALTFSSGTVPNLPEIAQDAILGFLAGGANKQKQHIIDAVLKRGTTSCALKALLAPVVHAQLLVHFCLCVGG